MVTSIERRLSVQDSDKQKKEEKKSSVKKSGFQEFLDNELAKKK